MSSKFYRDFDLTLSKREDAIREILFLGNFDPDLDPEGGILPAQEVADQWRAFLRNILPSEDEDAWIAASISQDDPKNVTYVDVVGFDLQAGF